MRNITMMLLALWTGLLAGAATAAGGDHAPIEPATPRPTTLTKTQPFQAVASGPERVKPGETFRVRYTIYLLDETHYLYKDACSVTVTEPGPFTFSAPKYWPAPEKTFDPFEQAEKEVYHHPLTMYLEATVPADAPTGKHRVSAVVKYRGCNKTVCFFPAKVTLPLSIEVVREYDAP